MESYFKTAPCVKWKDWAWSLLPKLRSQTTDPYLILRNEGSQGSQSSQGNPEKTVSPVPTIIRQTIESSRSISEFLGNYYYDPSFSHSLVVSPRLILHLLETKQAIGLELRDKEHGIIACIFEFFMGMYKNERVGLISWLCVHPKWRKKGLTNLLCHTITYDIPTAATIKWFRNDALFRSPLPPIYSSKIMDRQISQRKGQNQNQSFVKKRDFNICKGEFAALWKEENPTGIVFDSDSHVPTQLMIWGFEREDKGVWVLVQPTYEVKKEKEKGKEHHHGCEILQIVSHGVKDWYEKIQIFEIIVDTLPFDYCECSVEIPHIEALWSIRGISTWSTVGLHPGTPFKRPILSLVAS